MIQERNLHPALRAKVRSGALRLSPNNKVVYVDSGHANAGTGKPGSDPANPMSTLASALTATDTGVAATNGDVIVLLPGHAETISASITQSLAGITIIGIGEGRARPALTVAGAIDGINFTGADCLIENVRFPVANNAASVCINAGAARLTVRGCRFEGGVPEDHITVPDAGDGLVVEDCEFVTAANGTDGFILFESASTDDVKVRRNHFIGSDGTNACDAGCIEVAAAATNVVIVDNVFSGGGVATTAVSGVASLGVGAIVRDNTYGGGALEADSQFFVPGFGYRVTKSHNIATDNVDLFTVTGQCLVSLLIGEVTTVLATATTYQIRVKTSGEGLFLATTITSDADNTLYMWSGHQNTLLNGAVAPTTNIATLSAEHDSTVDRSPALTPAVIGVAGGTLTLESDLDQVGTGVVAWTLFYLPLEAGARIVAA